MIIANRKDIKQYRTNKTELAEYRENNSKGKAKERKSNDLH